MKLHFAQNLIIYVTFQGSDKAKMHSRFLNQGVTNFEPTCTKWCRLLYHIKLISCSAIRSLDRSGRWHERFMQHWLSM